MTINVRVFASDGITRAPVSGGTGLAYDSIQLMKLPYIAGQVLAVDNSGPVNSSPALSSNKATALLFAQVDPGQSVYYELTPAGPTVRPATVNSPILRGDAILTFGPNWTISVLSVN